MTGLSIHVRRIGIIPFVLAVTLSSCSPSAEIDRTTVDTVITTLAADDMEGRGTFTPGIERAAAFLESEFERIGLETMEGLDGYRQDFAVYSLVPDSSRIQINDRMLDGSSFFFLAGDEQVTWTTADNIPVTRVAPDEDFATVFTSARRNPEAGIILVDESHRDLFVQYSRFFSRPRRVLNMDDSDTVVFLLTSAQQANTYQIDITTNIETLPLSNVAGMISGNRADEFVLFSAHYDHIGIRQVAEGDSIANGANDDASGTTAVVALAEYFKKLRKPERSLLFVAFTAEEMGGYGASYFSEQLNPDQIVAMFNIEMIGKPAVEGPNTAWITGFDRSSFGEILQRAVAGTEYQFYPDPYPEQNLFFRSDNATLARLGVPAHSISTTPIDVDEDYHTVSDEVQTLDLDHMTNTIAAIAKGAETIISGDETPTRVIIEN